MGANAAVLAASEAWEEAGLLGTIASRACCKYFLEKAGTEYQVDVYLLQVVRCLSEWPEQHWRKRIWLPSDKAIKRLENAPLQDALERLIAQGTFQRVEPIRRAA